MSDRVVLIDGSGLIFRAFYALPANLSTASGLHTNATYGFALMFRNILGGKRPRYGAVVFDPPGPTFRDEKYSEYKAQRPSMPGELKEQLGWIDKLVAVHNFPMLRVSGYEADDVIGTLTKQAVARGLEVHIVSSDKDFAQLIGPSVRMVDTMKEVTYDAELARKKWGVPPSQFVDYLALVGDKVDNIPGVPGIGAKGAAKLLEQFGDLDTILESTDELKGRQQKNLREYREDALLSRDLATIDCAVPLPDDGQLDALELVPVEASKVNALYKELEFYRLLSEEEEAAARGGVPEDADYGALSSAAELATFLEQLAGQPTVVWPVVEPPHDAIHGQLVGVALSGPDGAARYVPLFGPDGSLGADGVAGLAGFVGDAAQPIVTHDLRELLCLLPRHDIPVEGVAGDTALASFLVDPTKIIPHTVDKVVKEFAHRTVRPLKTVTGSGKKLRPLTEIAVDEVTSWACDVAAALATVWERLGAKLEEDGLRPLLDELSLPMAHVLARMQRIGIRVDGPDLDAMGVDFRGRRAELEAEIYGLAGKEFNLGSPKQLGQVLFEDLGLNVIKKTKTGYSTNAEVLERLSTGEPPKGHPIAAKVLEWRALEKLINTYIDVLPVAVHPSTGRIHCSIQQTTGASGRLITTDPDLQRTPTRTEDGKRIRQAFIPREGWTLISADWSQIELRVLAHFSEDPVLIESFETGADLHRRTAARIFDVAPDEVTPQQREMGKTVNFATIYGQGATALGQQLGIPRKQAKQMIDRYFELYAGVREWVDAMIAQAHETGFVETIAGRRRYIPELTSSNFTLKAYGERVAANTPIQGSAADICKWAMLDIDRRLREDGLQSEMLLQIHDELLFEAPSDELERVIDLVRGCMREPGGRTLRVPLKVDVGHGASWAEAH